MIHHSKADKYEGAVVSFQNYNLRECALGIAVEILLL
jgi:hypothetical protein